MNKIQQENQVLNILKDSIGPVTGQELVDRIGMTGSNTGQKMREIIHDLRVSGWPICANGYGYFYGNESDVDKFIEEFKNRIASQREAIDGMMKGRALKENSQPIIKLFETDG